MLCRLVSAFIIINDNFSAFAILFHTIKKDHGNGTVRKRLVMIEALGVEGQRCNQSINSLMKKVQGIGGLLFKTLRRVSYDQIISRFCRYFFNPRKDGGDKVTVQFMDNDAYGICFLLAKITGECVMAIT